MLDIEELKSTNVPGCISKLPCDAEEDAVAVVARIDEEADPKSPPRRLPFLHALPKGQGIVMAMSSSELEVELNLVDWQEGVLVCSRVGGLRLAQRR